MPSETGLAAAVVKLILEFVALLCVALGLGAAARLTIRDVRDTSLAESFLNKTQTFPQASNKGVA